MSILFAKSALQYKQFKIVLLKVGLFKLYFSLDMTNKYKLFSKAFSLLPTPPFHALKTLKATFLYFWQKVFDELYRKYQYARRHLMIAFIINCIYFNLT